MRTGSRCIREWPVRVRVLKSDRGGMCKRGHAQSVSVVGDPYGSIGFSVAGIIGRILEDLKMNNCPDVTVIIGPRPCGRERPTILTRILPFLLIRIWSHSVFAPSSTSSRVSI